MTSPDPTTALWPPHVRISWGGTLGNPVLDAWSNSLRFWVGDLDDPSTLPNPEQLQQIADDAVPVLEGWMNDDSSQISNSAFLDWVKVNVIGSDGKQRDQNTVIADSDHVVGGTSDRGQPWYVTYALTLRTALRRGRSHSGRIYPPLTSPAVVAPSPYISVEDADGMSAAFARVIFHLQEAVAAHTSLPVSSATAVVISPGVTGGGGDFDIAPKYQAITGVVCDRVGDVMHSRNRQVPRAEGAVLAPAE